MNWGAVILPLLLAGLLLYILWYFARAAGQALARSREVTRFRLDTSAIAARIDPVLERIVARTDAARRHQIPPEEILDELAAGAETLADARVQALALHAPAHATGLRAALGDDLEWAGRAVEMIHFGCQEAAASRGRGSELEAQTAVKRGYLNLLHARESLAGHLGDVARVEPAPPPGVRRSRIWW